MIEIITREWSRAILAWDDKSTGLFALLLFCSVALLFLPWHTIYSGLPGRTRRATPEKEEDYDCRSASSATRPVWQSKMHGYCSPK